MEFEVFYNELEADFREAVRNELLSQKWLIDGKLEFTQLSCAMTNTVFKMTVVSENNNICVRKNYLLKLYGTNALFDRKHEIKSCKWLGENKIGPALLIDFCPFGRVEEWIDAVNLKAIQMSHLPIFLSVAIQMAKLHRLAPPDFILGIDDNDSIPCNHKNNNTGAYSLHKDVEQTESVNQTIIVNSPDDSTTTTTTTTSTTTTTTTTTTNDASRGSRKNSNSSSNNDGQTPLSSLMTVWVHSKQWWSKIQENMLIDSNLFSGDEEILTYVNIIPKLIDAMMIKAESLNDNHRSFCHNDLQQGNLLLKPNDHISIIDFEYSGYNYSCFDIANFFCEVCADYESDTPHLLNWNKFPKEEQTDLFISAYLKELYSNSNFDIDVGINKLSITSEMKATWFENVAFFVDASNLHWGIWGILQVIEHKSHPSSFDYRGYALGRLSSIKFTY